MRVVALLSLFTAALASRVLDDNPSRTVNSRPAEQTTKFRLSPDHTVIYSPRQEVTAPIPTPSVTSSFDWWPYPAWGASSSMSMSPVSTLLLSQSTANSNSDKSSFSMSNSTNIADSTSLSLVHLTALPPSNTSQPPSSLPKIRQAHAFHVASLAPLFAFLGVLLGSLSAWFCYGIYNARRPHRARRASLEPGPPYVGTPRPYREKHDLENTPLNDGHDATGSPSKYSSHGRTYHDPSRLWLARTLSTRQTPLSTPRTNAERPGAFMWPAVTPTPRGEEDDPFLAVPAPMPSRGSSTRSGGVLSLLGEYDYEELDMTVPYDSLRHKSIRRGILDMVRFGSGKKSERGSSEGGGTEQMETMSRADSVSVVGGTGTRSRSKEKPLADTDVDETEWVSGGGFRIVEEHLEDLRRQMRSPGWSHSADAYNPDEEDETPTKKRTTRDDKYTALPLRSSPSKGSRTTPRSSPARIALHGSASLPRVDSSVLPRSPPQITSPPLQSQLSFCASPSSRGQWVHTSGGSRSITTPPLKLNKADTRGTLSHSKIPFPRTPSRSTHRHGTDAEAILPSTPSPARTRRLAGDLGSGIPSSASQSSCHKSLGTPKQRYAARREALSKVEQIVQRSWSQRDLSGVASPTMFGAKV